MKFLLDEDVHILRIHPPQLEKLVAGLTLLLSKMREDSLFKGKLVIVEETGYHLLT